MFKESKYSTIYVLKITVVLLFVFLIIEANFSIFDSYLYIKEEYHETYSTTTAPVDPNAIPAGYLVWNKHCRIPDLDPFTPDAMKIFKKKTYSSCSKESPLTKIVYDMNMRSYSLHIDETAKHKLTDPNITCCYQAILRSGSGKRVDKDFKLKKCVNFLNGDVIPQDVENLIVTCETTNKKKKIQQDAFSLISEKPEIRDRLKSFRNRSFPNRPISVLMLGIDSVSKFNLRRVMPKTTSRLIEDNWFELKGYNKVDDNTFPNLMAFLTGYNNAKAYSKCNPKSADGLSNCDIIWKYYRDNGYVTSYSEDETSMSTFNFNKLGFSKLPVDYYHRPFMLAIEKTLKIRKQSGMTFCLGLRHSAEYVFDYAIELATRYKGEPYFGLFWTNTFSHNSFNDPMTMDTRIVKYIDELSKHGILDESVVIILSDHGMRFGPLRNLRQGFLEERLPFVFIWLPHWFRAKYPELTEALYLNKNRLTNPYDLHMTLKHILELSGRTSKLPQADSCANCQSLFYPVPDQRSCQDISIDEHWCTCIPYEDVDKKNKIVLNAIDAVLKHLNSFLEKGKFFPRCTRLKMKTVQSARKRYDFDSSLDSNSTNKIEHYRLRFTAQKGKFEASVTFSKDLKLYKIIDSVSRLDSYHDDSKCIEDSEAKKYCICDKTFNDKKKTKH